jgi:hypothetical protein
MRRLISRFAIMGVAATGLFFLSPSRVSAAGSNDGNWVFDFPQVGGIQSGNVGAQRCAAFRVPAQITDNQISGSLGRAASGTGSGALRSEGAAGSSESPITGTVEPDGSLNATWQNFTVTGQLGDGKGHVTVAQTGCGPRNGTAVRVAQ